MIIFLLDLFIQMDQDTKQIGDMERLIQLQGGGEDYMPCRHN